MKENASLKAQLQTAQDRLKALDWTPITPDNLPKVGDQTLHVTSRGVIIGVSVTPKDWCLDDMSRGWKEYRRPLNAPQEKP